MSVPLCDLEMWTLRIGVRRFPAFEHCCFCIICRIWWRIFSTNLVVRRMIPGPLVQNLDETLNLNRLRWFGHILHSHRTTALLYGIFRRGWWLDSWSVDTVAKGNGMKTLTRWLAGISCYTVGLGSSRSHSQAEVEDNRWDGSISEPEAFFHPKSFFILFFNVLLCSRSSTTSRPLFSFEWTVWWENNQRQIALVQG